LAILSRTRSPITGG
jgi:hypothetical protein